MPEVGKLYRHAWLDTPLRLVVSVEAGEREHYLMVETLVGGRRFPVYGTAEEWDSIYQEVA